MSDAIGAVCLMLVIVALLLGDDIIDLLREWIRSRRWTRSGRDGF